MHMKREGTTEMTIIDSATQSCHLRPCQSPIFAYCQEPAAHYVDVEGGTLELCEHCTARSIGEGWGEPVSLIAV
jgi:hypothetical protein